jgi:protein tyrosine phosphatase (PTP) superfamily phosphohydrolase (DUF442 family)
MVVYPNIIDDAGNLAFRAIPVIVGSLTSSLVVTFSKAMPDTNYGVFAMSNWSTTVYISAKSTAGFTLSFGSSGGGTGVCTYFVVGT